MTSVKELRRLASANSEKTIRIYNPDTEDFTCNFHGKPHTIGAMDMKEFPHDIGTHVRKHLAKHILFKRGIGRGALDTQMEDIYKEVDVDL